MVKGNIANFGIFLDFLSFRALDDFFRFSKKIGYGGILGPPYCGIGTTIRDLLETSKVEGDNEDLLCLLGLY